LFGTDEGCKNLTRAVFMMTPEDEPSDEEVLDALGEFMNMVSGTVKSSLGKEESQKLNISIPMFLHGEDCGKVGTKVIPVSAHALTGQDMQGDIFFVWTNRNAKLVMEEIRATLDAVKPDDTWILGQLMSLIQEVEEYLPENVEEMISQVLSECEMLITEVINDPAKESYLKIANESMSGLQECMDGKKEASDLKSPMEAVKKDQQSAGEDAPLKKVERDPEDVELFGDFLEEGDDGMERCDQILMEIEQGTVDEESINEMFRIYHSIKGVAACCELTDIQILTHATEDLLSSSLPTATENRPQPLRMENLRLRAPSWMLCSNPQAL